MATVTDWFPCPANGVRPAYVVGASSGGGHHESTTIALDVVRWTMGWPLTAQVSNAFPFGWSLCRVVP